jgi:integrase
MPRRTAYGLARTRRHGGPPGLDPTQTAKAFPQSSRGNELCRSSGLHRLAARARNDPYAGLGVSDLDAARVGEVLGAQWSEIDIALRTWIIPASRMKASREHRIPLSGRALAIVERMAELRSGDFVFPGQRRGRPLSNPSLARLCRAGVTVHGFRSAFRDWCGEETGFPREIAEAALAHSTGGPVEQAYRRGDTLEKRRGLMEAWATFCKPGAGGNVVPIRASI